MIKAVRHDVLDMWSNVQIVQIHHIRKLVLVLSLQENR